MRPGKRLTLAFIAVLVFLSGCNGGGADTAQFLPNMNQYITPLAPQGARFETLNPGLLDKPEWLAGQAVTSVTSPDNKTLLVLTSGYNRVYTSTPTAPYPWYTPDSNEYVFIYDISSGTPVKKQVVQVPNSYNGIVFDPSGKAFYVSGGVSDNVHVFTRIADGTWGEVVAPLALGHNSSGNGLPWSANFGNGSINLQIGVKPCAAGLAISSDGKTLVVANYYNDSISIFRGGLNNWAPAAELDLRPGKSGGAAGVPGGEYPFWVAVKGTEADGTATAYVSSVRDREIVVVKLNGSPAVTARIKVVGQPNKMALNKDQSLLYVVEDQSDSVDVIRTGDNAVVGTIPVIAPASVLPASLTGLRGANPNSVTISPDERRLLVTNGNLNSVAVVELSDTRTSGEVAGLIPTGWYPNSVSVSADGSWLYVVNGKSATGPNADFRYSYGPPSRPNGFQTNHYNPQLTKAGLQSLPLPAAAQLQTLTGQVISNNRFSYADGARDREVMSVLQANVKHVIFIIKENRTYDQILGDLAVGNGDPALAEFGERYTPNQHAAARTFVTLDNFYDTAEVSNDGWAWTTSGRAPDVVERQYAVAYAGRGLSLDTEGTNRSVNVAYGTLAERKAANPLTPDDDDLLPGQTDVAAPDGPGNEVNKGYLWDAALRRGLTVRNYGFFLDTTRYNIPLAAGGIPLLKDPAAVATQVAYPSSAALAPCTDIYYRGFDNSFPDYYRFKEWEREFDAYETSGTLPALSLVRLMHDHTGNFATAIDGVNTPEIQQADNDYAVGLLLEKLSKSPKYKDNTLVFIIEDDSQDGGDHVDSHRSIAFVAGAYVKQGALVSSHYNTVNFLRTIEEVLGLTPMNLNDALARPMTDCFTTTPAPWSFTAKPAAILYGTTLPPFAGLAPLGKKAQAPKPTHDAQYWAKATRGMDFSSEDKFDFARYNRILWKGLMGEKPYPAAPNGKDLRRNRRELLSRYKLAMN
ncbi:bifunctional YncE family protein/alkaline phosphatase family protein [Geomonas sp. Red69]|uniref:beta-propeller fold lactonase family protein n=1 Tax=Geomonas diazotrophica TaxID=2843197 RepID=UPI001C1048F1|nr:MULTISPECIES: beta-propeller fold lactonase family protein [Geomonas]MBU5635301.1 bifunctional YncE family protein/alkaline phosphatase family protein [Geomonas diazotrophica]QXE86782.1 bifunctional YncE family protein/alkaline phosphatase family protein [Geomonas nitrogeniifigens]